jgi:hypothetical protein
MPSDIIGTEVIEEDRASGRREIRFIPGPVFANVILADEINRTPPKTQAALLEAMQQYQVTINGIRYELERLDVHLADSAQHSASRTVLVRSEARRIAAAPALSMLAASHRGIDVTPDRVEELKSFMRRAVAAPNADAVRRPMRSTWWIQPLTVCLSAAWWIRRGRGRR